MTSKNGKRPDEGQYVALPYAMLKSVAWRSLSGNAVRVWFELHTRYNGGNNGTVRLSMTEASETLSMSKATAQRAFKELQEKGVPCVGQGRQLVSPAGARMAADHQVHAKHQGQDRPDQ